MKNISLAIFISFVCQCAAAALTCETQSPLCLKERGQFAVPNECRKFANCWDFCATFSSCPGTLVFSGDQGRCDFSWNLSPDSNCYKPMAGSGGGMAPLPAINPMFAPVTFSPLFGGSMQQGMNQDGSLFQSMGR